MTQNNGFINVYSEPGKGSIFKIFLPGQAEAVAPGLKNGFKEALPAGSETILLVEDEEAILRMTRLMLVRLGYTVLTAHTPGEALRIAKEAKAAEIHLLMTEVIMPEMNGRDLSENTLALHPGLRRLFMSGYTANVIARRGVLVDKDVQFINKPFSMQVLAVKLREVLGKCPVHEK